ncbi:hypothetical protein [Komagataeibacter xylinus]|uniref:hypothetical protein n=1 Tax=Komagataeibacter xylinus TaxID=28448 RepID=UPI00280BB5E2|nr:hypothetical protein [Komagataeibacter xylinus]
MATVIDALVVTLGLDPKGVQKGQKEADTSFGKVKSSAQNMGKSVDAAATSGAQAIRTMSREALSFFAVLTAGKSLKAFVQDNTRSNVALGNLSRNLGVSAQSLGAWQKVAQSFGGTAEDVSGSMQSLVSQFQTVEGRTNLALTFGQMGVRLQGANGQLRDMNEMLPDLARAAQRLGPQMFSALGSQAGLSQGFINMLEQGPQKIEAMYAALKKYAPTKADTQASGQLMMDWTKLTAQSEAFGRTIMTSLTPELHHLLSLVSGLVDKYQDTIRTHIDDYVKRIGDAVEAVDWKSVGDQIKQMWDYLRSIDWKAVGDGIKSFASGANTAAQAVGGWSEAVRILFDLWLGSKFIKVIAAVRQFAALGGFGAKGAQGALGIGGGVLGGVLATGASGAFATYQGLKLIQEIDHDTSDEGKQENRRKIYNRHDPYYSSNRYTDLEQAQRRQALTEYGTKTLHLDPKEVADLIKRIQEQSGFNTQAIGNNGRTVGMFQWGQDEENWIEQQSGQSAMSMSAEDQMKWDVAARQPGGYVPRGVRNNNPGNLEYQGQRGARMETGVARPRYAAFPTMEAGIQALRDQLVLYKSRGIDSVDAIISKYAPKEENDTAAYIAQLSRHMGVSPDAHLDLRNPAIQKQMIAGIAGVEIGHGQISQAQIDRALSMGQNRGGNYNDTLTAQIYSKAMGKAAHDSARAAVDATAQNLQAAQDNSTSNSTVNNNAHITGNYHMVFNGADPQTTRRAVEDSHSNLARQANSAFPA